MLLQLGSTLPAVACILCKFSRTAACAFSSGHDRDVSILQLHADLDEEILFPFVVKNARSFYLRALGNSNPLLVIWVHMTPGIFRRIECRYFTFVDFCYLGCRLFPDSFFTLLLFVSFVYSFRFIGSLAIFTLYYGSYTCFGSYWLRMPSPGLNVTALHSFPCPFPSLSPFYLFYLSGEEEAWGFCTQFIVS